MAQIDGDNGNNILIGTPGSDVLRGFDGNDLLDGAGGSDTMRGGGGDDVYLFDGGDTLIESANQGIDEVRSSVSMTLGNHFENLVLTGSASINGAGNSAANVIAGNAGNNVLNGNAGIDTFQMTRAAGSTVQTTANLATGTATGHGNDTIVNFENVRGTDFGDRITGNAGNNVLDGAGGHDEFVVSGGSDTLIGGDGADAVLFTQVGAALLDLAAATYSLGAAGQGSVAGISHAVGSAQADVLAGNADVNHLSGGAGGDVISGGGGDDQLWGGAGSDRLVADLGSDTLVGNSDAFGGGGDNAADTFEIRPGAVRVTVTDFQPGVDKIDLSAFDLGSAGSVWTASGSYAPDHTRLQLSDGSRAVEVLLQGLTAGEGLSLGDFIGATASVMPVAPAGPVNGGNGVADVFVVDPQAVLQGSGGVLDLVGFEDGLDQVDLTAFDLNNGTYWGGWIYDHGPSNQTRMEFWGQAGEFVVVNLVGHNYHQVDPGDFIL